ncbi:hypothetical protein HanIR_Chr14g0674171 [Helianthus annuus]|nr:hypothetical protein HanIR_Chr14g0674171 [Helianthus annuus]
MNGLCEVARLGQGRPIQPLVFVRYHLPLFLLNEQQIPRSCFCSYAKLPCFS